MAHTNRTRIDIDVDAVHLAQVMRRFDVSEVGAAIALALELAASSPTADAGPHEQREADTVEEVVSLESLHRFTSP